MEYPPPRTNEEINFIKGSLLLTSAIKNGLLTLLSNKQDKDLECLQSYDFQKLCDLLLNGTNSSDIKLHHGLAKLADVREHFFHHVSQQSITDREFDALKEQIVKGFEELKLSLSDVYDICKKSTFSEDEVLTAHEQLSLERRGFCYLGPSCYHTTIQRTAEVNAVLQQLNDLSQRNQSGNSTVFIDGQCGSGKREFAKQVAETLHRIIIDQQNKPKFVMTLNAETEETLLSSYVKFATELLCNLTQIQMAVTSKGLLIEERLRLLNHIIGDQLKRYPQWVVVIANVNHFESMSEFWPKPGSNDWGYGYLIVTLPSINDIKRSLDSAGHVSLSRGMQPSQGIQLLSEVSGIAEKEYCLEVAELLEFQPLALSCAAVFIRNLNVKKSNSPWKVFLELFREYNALCQDKVKETSQFIYSQSCSIAIKMLQMQVLAQNQEMSGVTYLFTLFQPFHIEKEMLSDCLTNIKDSNIVSFLHDISPLLSVERSSESDMVSLRHYNSDSCQSGLDEKGVEILTLAAISLAQKSSSLENVQSILNDCTYSLCCRASLVATKIQGLSDNLLESFIDHLITSSSNNNAVDILLKLADQCHLIQQPQHSKTLLTIAKSIMEKEEDPDVGRFARVLHGLGVASCDIGSDDAKGYLDKLLEFYCQEKDVSHEKVADVLVALGDVAVASEDLVNAKAFYRKALKTTSSLEHGDNIGVPLSWYKLGNILAIEGSFQLAKEHYEKALKLMGNDNFVILTKALTCVGAMSVCVDEYHLAKEYLEKAMAIEQRLYSKYHPYRLSSIKNAANAYKALDDHDSAERLLRESITISKNITCQLNADVAQVFSQLGSLRAAQEDWESAIECYGNALEIQENILQCHLDPVIADRCCDLGHAYARSGQLEIAKSFHERALGIRGLLFHPDHPDLGTSYLRLGKVYNKLGDYQTASSLLERAVEIRGKIFGPQHPETLDSLYHLGHSFARLGRLKNARSLYQSVEEGQVKLKESNSAALAKTSESLGEVNLGLGEIEFAKQQFKRAIELQKCATGPNHPEVARPLVRLALVHEHCKEIKEAKTLLEMALAIYRKNTSKISRSHVIVTEAHLKRVLLKLPQNRCILM